MDWDSIFTNVELIKTTATVVVWLALVGVGALVAKMGVVKPVMDAYHYFRPQIPALVEQVDEPTDLINTRLEQITRIPAAVWAAFLPTFFNALATGLDAALQTKPAPEPTFAREAVPSGELTTYAAVGPTYAPPGVAEAIKFP